MRSSIHPKLTFGRVRTGILASDDRYGVNGVFSVASPLSGELKIIASDGTDGPLERRGWEHVSVSLRNRCPNWTEMCFVKALFWDEEETVVQFHPPKSQWISNHPYCLHLWRHSMRAHELPPSIMVGIQELGDMSQAPQRDSLKVFRESNRG